MAILSFSRTHIVLTNKNECRADKDIASLPCYRQCERIFLSDSDHFNFLWSPGLPWNIEHVLYVYLCHCFVLLGQYNYNIYDFKNICSYTTLLSKLSHNGKRDANHRLLRQLHETCMLISVISEKDGCQSFMWVRACRSDPMVNRCKPYQFTLVTHSTLFRGM